MVCKKKKKKWQHCSRIVYHFLKTIYLFIVTRSLCVLLLLFSSLDSWVWGSVSSYSHSFSFSPAAHFIRFWSQAIKSNEHLLPRVGSRASPLNIPCVAEVCFTCTWLFKQSGETCRWSLLASGLSRLSHKQSDPRSLIGSRPIEHFTFNPGLNPVAFLRVFI